MSGESDLLDEVTPELVRRVEAALAEERAEEVRALLADLSATGPASILERVGEDERDKLIGQIVDGVVKLGPGAPIQISAPAPAGQAAPASNAKQGG